MDDELIVQQTTIELEALDHVTRALLVAIEWTVTGDDVSRKLSSVRFATELLQRFIERVFSLEELDGYMASLCRLHPEWTNQIDDLKREHDDCRTMIRKLVLRLDRASPTDHHNLESICAELRDLIQRLLEHSRRESDLLVESTLRDTGGQG